MYTLIGKVDYTGYVPHDSLNVSSVAGDPLGKATFTVVDPAALLALLPLQEVILIDETVSLGGNTLIPTHNYLNNNNFNYATTGWTSVGTLSGRITYPSSGTFGVGALATLIFSNQAVGSALAAQNTTNVASVATQYVIVGQTYCFSATVNVTSTFSNAYALLELNFLNASGSTLTSTQSVHLTSTASQRISVQATAPAGAVTIQAAFGGITTSTTNSGTATFTALQLESVWFPALYSYPTPICDLLQADSVTLPDGTTSRFDRIFCGNITHLTVHYEGTTRLWDVEATSIDGILENVILVNATYANVTDQFIISDVFNKFPSYDPPPIAVSTPSLATTTPQALAYRNVPVVYAGATIASIQYADSTIREVVNSLTDITGFLFGVDPYYNLFYYPPFYNAAPYSFSSSPDGVTSFAYYDYSIEYDASQLQTELHISGSTYEVAITENFTAGDGTHNQFIISGQTAGFYLSFAPSGTQSVPTISFGGTTQTITSNTGAGYNGSHLLFDQPNHIGIASPLVNNGTSISATYTYQALVYVQCAAPGNTAAYGRRLWSKINDNGLTSNAAATARGEAQFQAYAIPRVTLKFKTVKMLLPGQVLDFTSALDSLTDAHFTIQKVTATCLGNGVNQYEIEAGTYVDDFVDFFRNSQKAINRASHDPATPLQQVSILALDNASYTDSLNMHP